MVILSELAYSEITKEEITAILARPGEFLSQYVVVYWDGFFTHDLMGGTLEECLSYLHDDQGLDSEDLDSINSYSVTQVKLDYEPHDGCETCLNLGAPLRWYKGEALGDLLRCYARG